MIWMSSLVAAPYFDPVDDWQLTKTLHSYESSKFQIDLIASELERLGTEAKENATTASLPDFVSTNGAVHHLISSPGVVPTNMMSLLGANTVGHRASAAFVFWVVSLATVFPILSVLTACPPDPSAWMPSYTFVTLLLCGCDGPSRSHAS